MQSVTPAAATIKFPVGATIPFIYGAQDAASGLICVPEQYFVQRRDQRDYAAGWASVRGQNETTRFFLGSVN